jgi:hypothetical protein
MTAYKNSKRRKQMKKIILGIITIILAVAIFGCGKAQQASGGGSSGGGDGNGGGNETPQTFSIQGYVPAAAMQTVGMSAQATGDEFEIKVFSFADNNQWSGNTWKPNANGYYKIDGLPLGKVFIVEAQKGQTKMRNLAFGSADDKGQTKTADITPTSTVTVELISANAAETLKSFNENTDLTSAVEEVQAGVDTYYTNNTDLTALKNAITGGNVIPNLADVKAVAIVECELTIIATNGTVALTPSPNSSNGNVHKYLKNTKVKLLATGSTGYILKEWSDADVRNNEIAMDMDKGITAVFAEKRTLKIPEMFLDQGSGDVYIMVSPDPKQPREKYQHDGFNVFRYVYADGQPVEITLRNMTDKYSYSVQVADATNGDSGLWDDVYAGDTHTYYLYGTTRNFTQTMDKDYALRRINDDGKSLGALAVNAKTIDGDTSDWSNGTYSAIYEKGVDSMDKPNSEYASQPGLFPEVKSIKASRDNNDIYVLWEMENGFSQGWIYVFDIRPNDDEEGSVRIHIQKNVNNDGYDMSIGYNAPYPNGWWENNKDSTWYGVAENGNIFEARLPISFVKDKIGNDRLQRSDYYAVEGKILHKEDGGWSSGGGGSYSVLMEKF